MSTRRDRTGYYSLTLGVTSHFGTQLFDHPDRLVTDSQSLGDGILTFQNMHVRAAYGGGGDSHQSVCRANLRNILILEHNSARLHEHCGFHFSHIRLGCCAVVNKAADTASTSAWSEKGLSSN